MLVAAGVARRLGEPFSPLLSKRGEHTRMQIKSWVSRRSRGLAFLVKMPRIYMSFQFFSFRLWFEVTNNNTWFKQLYPASLWQIHISKTSKLTKIGRIFLLKICWTFHKILIKLCKTEKHLQKFLGILTEILLKFQTYPKENSFKKVYL